MPYEPYVTYEYYCDAYKGTVIPMDELDRALKQASRHVDSLTYNRIVGRGFSNLTAFQQETIQEVVCQVSALAAEWIEIALGCPSTASAASPPSRRSGLKSFLTVIKIIPDSLRPRGGVD